MSTKSISRLLRLSRHVAAGNKNDSWNKSARLCNDAKHIHFLEDFDISIFIERRDSKNGIKLINDNICKKILRLFLTYLSKRRKKKIYKCVKITDDA